MRATLFLESSAVARQLVEGDPWLSEVLAQYSTIATSRLTALEVQRALDRALAEGRLAEATFRERREILRGLARRSQTLAIDEIVLEKAGRRFPKEPVRTLDAIHLGSAMIWQQTVDSPTVASFDRRIRENALALGMDVVPRVL